jgi:uroporphyrinogen-III synthase
LKPRLLVVRSGGRPFPAELIPALEVVDRNTHEIVVLPPDAALLDGRFDRVIVTSRAAVEQLVAREDLRKLLGGPLVAVGPATAELLRAHGAAQVEEGGGSARRILEMLPPDLAGLRILLPRGEDADDGLAREIARRGAEVVPLTLYRKVARDYDPALDALVTGKGLVAFCPTSPSAARWLLDGASPDARDVLRSTPAVVLGESTRDVLVQRGHAGTLEIASPPSFEAAAGLALSLAGRGAGA